MTDKVREALRAVIQYNWRDELMDYMDHDCQPGHVFEHLVVLDNEVEGTTRTPYEWVDEHTA